ncbi:hypothetical protein, partial [Pseudomonas piscis]
HLFLSAFDREDRNANKAKTLPYQLLLGLDELKRYRCRKPCNSLNFKEFPFRLRRKWSEL